MTFIQESDMRERARRRTKSQGLGITDALKQIANKKLARYDIFLSQTIRDAEIVLGVVDLLTEKGYTVFCDWLEAPEIDRGEVTPANAAFVRKMMSLSETLLFLDTENADQSLWMCWELGWFDGNNGRVAVLPVLIDGNNNYRSREFLGLYPYVELDQNGKLKVIRPIVTGPTGITIIEAPNYRSFDNWRKDSDPINSMIPRSSGVWRPLD